MLEIVVLRECCPVLSPCPVSPSHTEHREAQGAGPPLGVTHHVVAEQGPGPQEARVCVSASHAVLSCLPNKSPAAAVRVTPHDFSAQ